MDRKKAEKESSALKEKLSAIVFLAFFRGDTFSRQILFRMHFFQHNFIFHTKILKLEHLVSAVYFFHDYNL